MSPGEIYMFIVGRVLVALGLGIVVERYFPVLASYLMWPLFIVGLVLLLVGSRVFFRRR
jgi:hypothetical protein